MSFRAETAFIDDESEYSTFKTNKLFFLSLSTTLISYSSHIMSNVDWNSKTVIGQKAKAAKVTKNESDLNGASDAMTHMPHSETYPSLFFS
jgi:hypothetical protein